MPFPWVKPSLKSTSKQENRDNVASGVQSWLRPSAKCFPGAAQPDISVSPGRKFGLDPKKRTPNKAVSGPDAPSTAVSQSSSFTEVNRGHPLPLPYPASALHRTDSADVLFQTSGACTNSEPLFRLPSPSKMKSRTEGRDGDGAISGYGSGSTSSFSSLSSADMPDLHNSHREKNIFEIRLTSETEMQEANWNNNPNMLQVTCSPNCGGQDFSLLSGNSVVEKSVLSVSPRRLLGGVKNATQLQPENQVNATVSSPLNSLLSSPRLSPRRDYNSEQSCPAAPPAVRNSEPITGGTGLVSSPKSRQSARNGLFRDASGSNLGQQGRGSQECSPLPSPRMPRIRTGPSSGAPSSTASPMHPAASVLYLDSTTSSMEDSRAARHPLPLPPGRLPAPSPYASPPIPSSPTSVQLHGSSRTENTMNSTSQWQKGKLLGSGTFGNVYKGFSDSGTFCAMKEVLVSDDPRSKESVKQLGQEIQMLSQLRHPNIVQYLGSEIFEDRLYIYLEYVSGGSIHKLLQEYGQFKEPVIRSYTRQILCGLAYLHSMQTVHRDIKGANILVDTNGEVKLADFGMAKHINTHSIPLSFKGSPYWMAPEVFKSTNGYNYPVDIWSLGCTIIEMATAKPPWSQYEGIAALFKIGNSKEVPSIPESLSKDGQEFVKLCLRRDPLDRPSASELLEHPFARNAMDAVRVEEMNHGLDFTISNTAVVCSLDLGLRQDNNCEAGRRASQPPVMVSSSSELLHPPIGNVSPMASPCNSPKFQSRTSYHTYGGFSPSPISSPLVGSGSSTPRSGGYGSLPFTVMPVQSTIRSSSADNYGDMARRPDRAFGSSPGRYTGLDIESSDPNGSIRSVYISPRNGMYRFV
ncbi:hypothetical protein O6H91_08G036100 [Diphasiastrum complanatum]|uniref:Uncharacterized protein n=1 Tax=Diphasiastrum complanatum TaxID=34168 RepID=A0ACC2CWQ9_DIPCM|nr:hypothetical protein O6H91_08G036100 [Diphasiastrum complanatum]